MSNDLANSSSESQHSVSRYIEGLRFGDEEAAQKVWERFVADLIRLAAKKFQKPGRVADEEDVVQQAFAQFFKQVQDGRFSKLNDRNDLWQVLCMLVDRRGVDQMRRNNADVRGGGNVRGHSAMIRPGHSEGPGFAGLPNEMEPTPELAKEISEAFRVRMNGLENPEYQQVALMKMEGYTNQEIAERMKSTTRTVERRLSQIRKRWEVAEADDV